MRAFTIVLFLVSTIFFTQAKNCLWKDFESGTVAIKLKKAIELFPEETKDLLNDLDLFDQNPYITYENLKKEEKKSENSFENKDPNLWPEIYPTCAGKFQSPINVEPNSTVWNPKLKPIVFNNYEVPLLFKLSNNGYTISAIQVAGTEDESATPFISGSNFGSTKFRFKEFHFHWGSSSRSGSEHKINDAYFPAEMHLVHQSPTGKLAVVGFFFQISEENNPRLDSLLDRVRRKTRKNSSSTLKFSLSEIIPDPEMANANGYYRYLGSLTTPPCTEGILWNLYREPINISAEQMKSFYTGTIDVNYRPVQPLGTRVVYSSVKSD